jgi:predicted metal-dependent phosphoesterase TrpH
MAVDLHLHTTASSDGEFSPREIVELAKANRLEAIALTDHDSVNGLEEGLYWGQKLGLEVIPGCEIASSHEGKWLHILGYFIDYRHPEIVLLCDRLQSSWENNIDAQIARLREAGFYLEKDKVLEDNPRPMFNAFGAAMFADPRNDRHQLLNEYRGRENYVIRFCMDWVAPGRPYNAPQGTPEATDVIKIIKDTGGVPILAHPGATLGPEDDALIDELLTSGLAGLEVFCSYHKEEQEEHYSRYCSERRILVTCGSDFHGKAKPHVKMGAVKNNTYGVLARLKASLYLHCAAQNH